MHAFARVRVCIAGLFAAALASVCPATDTNHFVNWESPHVAPIAMTPDGAKLLAVNTDDAKPPRHRPR
jgi:hypothetical protein